jgi:hypothetical protein
MKTVKINEVERTKIDNVVFFNDLASGYLNIRESLKNVSQGWCGLHCFRFSSWLAASWLNILEIDRGCKIEQDSTKLKNQDVTC